MERLVLEIGIVFVVYLIGYRMGVSACFNDLCSELEKKKNQEKEKE